MSNNTAVLEGRRWGFWFKEDPSLLKRAKRYKRYSRKEHHCRFGGDIRLIKERPDDINSRIRFGHWEGDTIQFMGNKKQVITTLVERKSRMVFLIKN